MTRTTAYGSVQRAADCAGLTYPELARVLSVSVRQVMYWASGERRPAPVYAWALKWLGEPRERWPEAVREAVAAARATSDH